MQPRQRCPSVLKHAEYGGVYWSTFDQERQSTPQILVSLIVLARQSHKRPVAAIFIISCRLLSWLCQHNKNNYMEQCIRFVFEKRHRILQKSICFNKELGEMHDLL